MSGHRVVLRISNETTGEELHNVILDKEYAIEDDIKTALASMVENYRRRYPVGLRGGITPSSPLILPN
jgi:hypothetical protein